MKMSMSEVTGAPKSHASIGALLIQLGFLSPRDVERVLQLQHDQNLRFGEAAVVLELVNEADMRYALSRQFDYSYLQQTSDKSRVSEEVLAARQPFNPLVDQMRSIRSQLLLNWFDKAQGRNVISVVGAEPAEGRSYLAANLATVFSQASENTLLIDANLRGPRQHALFGLDNRVGLSSILAGHRPGEAIIRISDLSGLFLLPAGPTPPNPLELFSRPAWAEFLIKARSNFDCVIIDTPALSAGEDAAFVAVRSGAALMVARSGVTHVTAFSRMARSLTRAGVDVVGSVWNDVPPTVQKK